MGVGVDLLSIAPETAFGLNPIVLTTPRKVFPSSDLEEEIAGVEMTVRVPQRNVRAIAGLGQDNEFQELIGSDLVCTGGG